MASLNVGGMTFANRHELMAAMDHERALRDYSKQLQAVEKLQQQLNRLLQQPSLAEAWAPKDAETYLLTELPNHELERRSQKAGLEQQRLTIELAQQRASLERGARLIPEVSPLEERTLALRGQVDHLDAFGVACRMAAQNLADASEEIRRAYAPKLQAYLSRDLAQVTDGRYSEALVSDRFEVLLRVPETRSMVDLKQLSRGTQQQIYLLLRLGLMEVMGGGTETLPLFLDDALALADDDRRAELLKVLEAEQRQVIYFTAGETGAARAFGPKWHRVTLPKPMSDSGAVPEIGSAPLRMVESQDVG